VTALGPAPRSQPASPGNTGPWQQAARLRREHPGWSVVWLAPAGQFRAYPQLPGARRDAALTAPTAAGLADQITRAGRAAPGPPPSEGPDMTDTTPGPAQTAGRMRAITAELTAAGLDARVHDTLGVLDVTATAHQSAGKDIDIIVDEDHYVEIRYWSPADATPSQVVAVISRALAAITTPP
jgi:hypothetical protein